MVIVGIDASGPVSSVALIRDDALLAEERLQAGARASREVLPALDRVMTGSGLSLERVDGFAAVRGPGSFTGLRVGLATARGLAMALGRPAVGFSALDLLARQAPVDVSRVSVWIDAKREEVYTAEYRKSQGDWELETRYGLLSYAGAAAQASPGTFLGSGAERYRVEIEKRGPEFRVVGHCPHLAADAARAWARLAAAGVKPDPESLRPLYIRLSDAERKGHWRPSRSTSTA